MIFTNFGHNLYSPEFKQNLAVVFVATFSPYILRILRQIPPRFRHIVALFFRTILPHTVIFVNARASLTFSRARADSATRNDYCARVAALLSPGSR